MNSSEHKTSRQMQAEETRRRIYEVAYALLQEKEFDKISIREIVARAGVSTGTFYFYFPSKLDVFYQTYNVSDEYFASTVAPMLTRKSVRENLLIFFDQYAHHNCERAGLRLTKLLFNSNNTRFILCTKTAMHVLLGELVQGGLNSGELDGGQTADEIVQFLMYAVRGLVYNWCINDGEFDLRKAMHAYVSKLFPGICAP